MYGKANTHVIRLAGTIEAIENAFKIVTDLEYHNKILLCDDLKQRLIEKISQSDNSVISAASYSAAKRLIDYFTLHRMIMAGYPCKLTESSNSANLEHMIQSIIENVSIELDDKTREIINTIYNTPGADICCRWLNQNKKYDAKLIASACSFLQEQNLGKIESISQKNGKGVPKKIFKKNLTENITNNVSLIAKLESLGIDLNTYIVNFAKPSESIYILFIISLILVLRINIK